MGLDSTEPSQLDGNSHPIVLIIATVFNEIFIDWTRGGILYMVSAPILDGVMVSYQVQSLE